MEQKLGDLIIINPRMQLKRGVIARKIAMDDLVPFSRDVASYSYSKYTGGTKFQNGDTLLARITPCLENGKTAFVNMLNDDEVAFGSTEYWILRPKDARILPYYLYYLSVSPNFRKMMIKSMTGTSGRQRVPRNVVEEFSFNLPSLEIQQKAAHSLKIIDDKIALNNKINANLVA